MTRNPEKAKISVIVPVYNSEHTLKQCLQALKEQNDANYEVIVVDDASQDNSQQIARKSGFKTLNLPANKGQAVARNAGVKQASGEIIAFVDADVRVPVDWLKKYRQLLVKYTDADMICSGYSENTGDGLIGTFAFYETVYRRLNIPLYISASTSSNAVIYKQAFEVVGGYPEYYISANQQRNNQKAVAVNEDAELGFLLGRQGSKIVWSHENPVGHYFRNSWKAYLKQQIAFSRYALLSVFKFPGMLSNQDIYSKQSLTAQLAVALIMLGAVLGLFFGPLGVLVTIVIETAGLVSFYFLNRKFIGYLQRNMINYSFRRVFYWLIVARLSCLYGLFLGFKDGCLMLFNKNLKR
ncbi:glycosyltransferase [Candidatus Omnitrophota bacterium]